MSLQRPLEGLLRPVLEWYSSLASLVGAFLLYRFADSFLLPQSVRNVGIFGLSVLAVLRFKQGYRVWQMRSSELPVESDNHFLGKGFLWKTIHTQRLRDLDLAYNAKFKCLKKNEAGGEAAIHGISDNEKEIYVSHSDRAGHMLVIGTTGVGKTRFAENNVAQDIRRGDVVIFIDPKGDAALLRRMYSEAKACCREQDLLVLHLGFPELSCRYNPLGNFTKITQVATRVTNGLPSSGEAASFKEFAWKYVNLVSRALVAIGIKPNYKLLNYYITNLENLFEFFSTPYFEARDPAFDSKITQFIEKNTYHNKEGKQKKPSRKEALLAYAQDFVEMTADDLVRNLIEACRLDKTYYNKIIASVGPLLEKLTTGEIADLLSPHYSDLTDERPIFDWMQVIRHKKIVYIGLDAMTDNVVSSAVGNSILSDLVSVAGHIYKFGLYHGFEDLDEKILKNKMPVVRIHADEFNEIIGDEFIPILNKSRGAGFNVTAYTQTLADIQARVGTEAKTQQVIGNFGLIVLFRTKDPKTVETMLNQLPKVPILRIIPASSSSDSPHGEDGIFYQSTNEDRYAHAEMRLIESNDVISLPKGQAFCILEGGKLYKLRMPLPQEEKEEEGNTALPSNIQQLILKMRERQGNG